jgi:hypothetical protein
MLLTTIGYNEGGGGGVTHSMKYFLNWLTLFMIFKQNLKIILVPSSYFPLLSQFHDPSLLNDIQVWNINTWTTTKDV